MHIVDRYLLRQYIKTFLICWCSLTGLYVVVDAFSNLDEFLRYAEESKRKLLPLLGEFYMFRSISFFDRVSAVLAMVSAMFTITWIQRHNELTALMAAGVSRIRTATPVMAAAVVVTFVAVACRELLIPTFRDQMTRDPRDLLQDSVYEMSTFVDNETDVMIQGQTYHPKEQRIHRPKFVLPPGLDVFGIHLSARDAVYLLKTDTHPAGYLLKEITSSPQLLKSVSLKQAEREIILTPVDHGDFLGADECFFVCNVDFDQLTAGKKLRQFMSTGELIDGLRNPSLDYGADVRVSIHSRIVQPLLDITLLFLGLPLVLRRETKNIYGAIGICVALTAAFMLVVVASQHLGSILYIRPSLAAWLPLLIFVPAAVNLYDRIDR
jgi:lipopolysaccharide export system permease protein